MIIGIIDFGLGNLYSVAGAVEKLNHTALISSRADELEKSDKLILPGVGAFADGMKNLNELGLAAPLSELVLSKKKPIIGICLGFQLMAEESYEFGKTKGLGWIPASVIKLEPDEMEIRVPHVGWNDMLQVNTDKLFQDIPKDALFYYTHSFHVDCRDIVCTIGTCDYGGTFTSVFHDDNIYGTQFHPEKSQLNGLNLLKNFIEKC